MTEYVGQAFVIEPDGDKTEVRAALRVETDGWWGGHLIGRADWLGIAGSSEPFFELRLPDGRVGACFVSELDAATTDQRVGIAGVGRHRSLSNEPRQAGSHLTPLLFVQVMRRPSARQVNPNSE